MNSAPRQRRRVPWTFLVLAAAIALVVGAASAWALGTVLRPSEEALDVSSYTFVSVERGEVGSSISLNAVAEWTASPIGSNAATGIVTGVNVAAGDEMSQGSTLYTVGLRPVVVAQGDVPAFRTIGAGVEGPDVAQAQAMLAARGKYSGPIDGKAGYRTVTAIRAWQKTMGMAPTGVIEVSDVIFVPTLPVRVALDTNSVARGKSLSGGEEVLKGLPVSPAFLVPVTDAQAAMIPTGTRVEITSPDADTWVAIASTQTPDPQSGTILIALEAEGDGAICGERCGQVPPSGQTLLPSKIVTVPNVSGLLVPSAALVSAADGHVGVIDDTGSRIPVTVIASARGMSVLTGVDAGTRVRVPATDQR